MNAILKTLIVTTGFALSAGFDEKTSVLSDNTKVVYNVSYDKVLDGAFVLSSPDDKLTLRGVYKENQRVGNWYAFNPDGTIFVRYNYDLKKIVSMDEKALSHVKVDILSKDETAKKEAMIPVPVCSVEQLISILGSEFKRKILKDNKDADGSLNVDFVANVDAEGKARYSAIYHVNGIKTTMKINVAEKLFDIDWIPATYKGEKLASTFTVNVDMDVAADGNKRQRFQWNY